MFLGRYLQEANVTKTCPEKEEQDGYIRSLFIFAATLIVLWFAFTAYHLSVFRRLKKTCVLLRNRFAMFVYLQVFGASFQLVWAVGVFIPRAKLPCSFYVTFPLSVMALQASPYIVRLLLFHNRIALNLMLARSILVARKNPTSSNQIVSQFSLNSGYSNQQSQESSSWFSNNFQLDSQNLSYIRKFRFLSSTKFGLILYVLGVLAWMSYSLTTGVQMKGCFSCSPSEFGYFEMFAAAVIIILITLMLLYRVRNEPDPMKIKADLLFVAASASVGISFWVLAFLDPGDFQKKGILMWMLGWSVTGFFFVYGLLGFPVRILDEKRRSRQLVTRNQSDFHRIINSRTGRDLLQVQMMNELNVEHFFFYLEANAWKKLHKSKNPDQVQIRLAQDEIISKYFMRDAPLAINISYDQKQAVFQAADKIDEHIFDESISEVKNLIASDVLPRFRATKAFKEVFTVDLL